MNSNSQHRRSAAVISYIRFAFCMLSSKRTTIPTCCTDYGLGRVDCSVCVCVVCLFSTDFVVTGSICLRGKTSLRFHDEDESDLCSCSHHARHSSSENSLYLFRRATCLLFVLMNNTKWYGTVGLLKWMLTLHDSGTFG